jgi:CelD/BcsL family acetyltransferase involved in cellulose biosynthesis
MASYRFIDDLDALDGEWTRLATRATNVFGTWEWASTWRKHVEPDAPIVTAVISRGELPIAVVPLHRASNRLVRVVRVVGHGVADELGPVCREEDRTDVARILRRAVDDLPWGWDVLLCERLPSDDAWARLGGMRLRRYPSPVLRFPVGTWEDFVRSRSSNQRQQIRRFERSLRRDHELRFRLTTDRDRLSSDLDMLFALHNKRWGNETTAFAAHESFHREFAARALENGWLRLWFMELDRIPVAAWYGFRFGGVESAYQSGREPALEDRSVGFVLLVHSMRAALNDGIREYRFLRGGEAYKGRFANEDRGLETVGVAKGVAGVAALWATKGVGGSRVARAALMANQQRRALPARTRRRAS